MAATQETNANINATLKRGGAPNRVRNEGSVQSPLPDLPPLFAANKTQQGN